MIGLWRPAQLTALKKTTPADFTPDATRTGARIRWAGGAIALIVSVATPVFAGTEFLTYEGRDAVHEGQGGNKKAVDGVDFWINGDPPRRFQVLGSITDSRHETGLWGAIRMSSLDTDIASAAKSAGGDAVILTTEGEKFLGAVGVSSFSQFNGFGSGLSVVRPIKSHEAQYVVVKYLPDDGPTAVPAASQAAQNNALQTPVSCTPDQIRYAQSVGVDCRSLGARWSAER